MPQINPNLANKLQMYRKILVQEFIREFNFLADVQEERATAKADFTDKLSRIITVGATGIIDNIDVPGLNFLNIGIEIVVDKINDKRKEAKGDQIKMHVSEIDQEQLRILLEMVALEASRRYEFIMDNYLSDAPIEAVIPLAKAQVERMLEYILRKQLPLNLDNLLTGLIAGHSGAYVMGWKNTRLSTQDNLKAKFTAEGLCGRPAFVTADKKCWVLIDSDSRKTPDAFKKASHLQSVCKLPKHKRSEQLNKTVNTFAEKLSYKKEALFNYGYTKLNKLKEIPGQSLIIEPKYGYVIVPQGVVTQFDYSLQPQDTMSSALTKKLTDYAPTMQPVTRQQIIDYLKIRKNNNNNSNAMSFNDFIRQKHPHLTMTVLEVNNEQELDFTGFDFSDTDFSECILNGITIKGSLANAKFQGSYLIAANLTGVNNAFNADFSGAHLEYLKAQGANLSQANFTHTNLHYSQLQRTNLQYIQHLGAVWIKAVLQDIQIENPTAIREEQAAQEQTLKKQQQEIEELRKQSAKQDEAIKEIQHLITNLEKQIQESKDTAQQEKTQQSQQLQSLLGELMQEKQSRIVFERYCNGELEVLQLQIKDTKINLDSKDRHIQQLQQRIEQLEQSHQELKLLVKTALEKLMGKTDGQKLFEEHCQVQFERLQQGIQVNASAIQKQQQELQKMHSKLSLEIQKLQNSEQEKQLSKIINQTETIVGDLNKPNVLQQNVTMKKLEDLKKDVHGYIAKQTEEITAVHKDLQKLQTSVEQFQQSQIKVVPEKKPPAPASPPVVSSLLQQSKVAKKPGTLPVQALSESFKAPSHPIFGTKTDLPLDLVESLKSGQFKVELITKGLKITYQQNDQKSNYTKEVSALHILKNFFDEQKKKKDFLIQGIKDLKIEGKVLQISTDYTADSKELLKLLEEKNIISGNKIVQENRP